MKFVFLEEIDSTNKYVKENLEELADKTVVYANSQTAGRGRMQRVWNSNSGDNIYASIVLKPSTELKEVYSNLTQYLSLTLTEVFEQYNVFPTIKWPNDVYVNNLYYTNGSFVKLGVLRTNGVIYFFVNDVCTLSFKDNVSNTKMALGAFAFNTSITVRNGMVSDSVEVISEKLTFLGRATMESTISKNRKNPIPPN